jgi:DNA ligase-associated metallophosphoesterase
MKTDWLSQQVASRKAMPFKFAGHMFIVDNRSAVYWIEKDLLIVSDLHIEKGSFLGQYANPIPHYDSRKTLSLLHTLIEDYSPTILVSLGDSFHDVNAFERMQYEERELLLSAVRSVDDWVWILGNHDPSLPAEAGGRQEIDWQLDNVLLTHEPVEVSTAQIMGHYHPKASVKHHRLKVRGRSLLTSTNRLIMPAFGQYTGGLESTEEVLSDVLGTTARSGFVLAEQRVFPF